MSSPRLVIYDCDGGSDDAWGLILLLKAHKEKRINLLGITVTGSGNTTLKQAAHNMLRTLKAYDNIDIPIFLGASNALIQEKNEKTDNMNGVDGFGDILPPDEINIDEAVDKKNAVPAIYELCKEHSKKITIIAVAPLTNIALCLVTYGEELANSINSIYIMGGNHQGVGNATRSAEFNFYADPEAAHIVFEKAKCELHVLPWETCLEDRFNISLEWRLGEFGTAAALINKAVDMLNKVESAQYIPNNFTSWMPCDAMLVAAFLYGPPYICKKSSWHITVDLTGQHTRGQMVLDHLHKLPKNTCVIEQVDSNAFKQLCEWAVGLKDNDLSLDVPEDELKVLPNGNIH